MHGLFGQGKNWHSIASKLSQKHDIYVPDLPNHGHSYHSKELNYEFLSKSIVEFLEQMHLSQVNFIAHSMGGKTAMTIALKAPEYIHQLVIVDIAPVTYEHDFSQILLALQSVPVHTLEKRRHAEKILSESINDHRIRQFLLSNLAKVKGRYCWQFNLASIQENINEIVNFPQISNKQFNSKCWFVAGMDSDYINKNDSIAIKKYFPKANIIKIKNAGHWVHVEQAE
ncbi:MAG: alpha/beta fold hydrolase, partial [Gammaproteobacteria bacterium]|nr:alpha/beta fold hydrolase [Gammaproteobacteria bacterium]